MKRRSDIWIVKERNSMRAIEANSFGKDDRRKRQLTNAVDEDEGKTFVSNDGNQLNEKLTHFRLNDC